MVGSKISQKKENARGGEKIFLRGMQGGISAEDVDLMISKKS